MWYVADRGRNREHTDRAEWKTEQGAQGTEQKIRQGKGSVTLREGARLICGTSAKKVHFHLSRRIISN